MIRALLTLLRFVALLAAYAAVRAGQLALAPRRRAGLLLAVMLVALATLLVVRCERRHPPLRVATYNIRHFGVEPTDLDRLAAILADLDADIVAVQEIRSEPRLIELLGRLRTRGGRRYAHTLSACGGRSEMLVGFLYDPTRVALRGTREYPELDPAGGGRCTEGERPGLLGEFAERRSRRALHLLTVHLAHGGDAERMERRRVQWARAHQIMAQLRAAGARDIALLGDTNSTDYLDNAAGERDFIHARAAEAGMHVATGEIGCSEYWRPRSGQLVPSLLDHVVASSALERPGSARVYGYCAELACRVVDDGEPPADYARVSDHCPVAFDLAH